jgi:hypothetical protein
VPGPQHTHICPAPLRKRVESHKHLLQALTLPAQRHLSITRVAVA